MLETAPTRDCTRTPKAMAGLLNRAGAAPRPDWNICGAAGVVESKINTKVSSIERMVAMSRLTKAIRSRRDIARTRRELNRAITNASTPAMRDELIMVAQRAGNVV
jgi:hypothetical protein